MKRLTKAEIIDETVAFYSEDPEGRRAVDEDGVCQYVVPKSGCRCAVGRCMTKRGVARAQRQQDATSGSLWSLVRKFGDLDCLLFARYRGHGVGFWAEVQTLHDGSESWNGELSPHGGRVVADLRDTWI